MMTHQAGASASTTYYHKPFFTLAIDRVGSDRIDALLDLQHFAGDRIIPRSRLDLQDHFAHGNYAFGVIDREALVGQALLTFEQKAPGVLMRAFATSAPAELHVGKIGTVVVAPGHRKAGAASGLIEACEATARIHECDAVYARVQTDAPSVQLFLRHGFAITATGRSPDRATTDVSLVHTLVKPLSGRIQGAVNVGVDNVFRPA